MPNHALSSLPIVKPPGAAGTVWAAAGGLRARHSIKSAFFYSTLALQHIELAANILRDPWLGKGSWQATLRPQSASLDARRDARWRVQRQVGVMCHKVTTLPHFVGVAATESHRSTKMSEADFATPRAQSAPVGEKTFTRHPPDTLRSHPSCIGVRRFTTTDGAADVSGR
jgi:hypothetical protein